MPAQAPVQERMERFAWSYSKLKNFETCPRRYSETDLKKKYEEKSQELTRGDDLHNAMYARLSSGRKLPGQFSYMEHWAAALDKDVGVTRCEEKLAIDRNFNPTGFFDRTTWLRGKIDYLHMEPSEAMPDYDIGHIVDYKTGKPRDDYTQLASSALLVFATFKDVIQLRADFLWTEYNERSHEIFKRSDMREVIANLLPRVSVLEQAHIDQKFPETPNYLCYEWCPVKECVYNGTRQGRRA